MMKVGNINRNTPSQKIWKTVRGMKDNPKGIFRGQGLSSCSVAQKVLESLTPTLIWSYRPRTISADYTPFRFPEINAALSMISDSATGFDCISHSMIEYPQ